ncbi:histidine kinase [Paramagnetospirillum kuznetsovii]|uniref:histidine kinase n=1 Tax=Paramagnetospirillum kuznetsovii TaxID=2053833 RepID=A0A364NVY9_9PROT|nr:histidine kinase [Paramagnetospirillum kuznetsovii]
MAAALVAVLSTLALLEVHRLEVDRRDEAVRAELVTQLGAIRARLESALTEPLLISRGLVANIVQHDGIADREFSGLTSIMLADYPVIRNLTLARGTVIETVYPEAANQAVIGVDYRDRPDQWPMVERAIQTRRPVLAGPVKLIQGGTALIGRVPIYLSANAAGTQRFYGLISVVIDIPRVFAGAGIEAERLPIRLAIRGQDGLGGVGGMVWGDEATFADHPVEMDVHLPGGSWRLAGLPKAGYDTDLRLTHFLGVFIAVLLALIWFGIAHYIVSLRTARWRASESEGRYRALVETAPMAVCAHRDGEIFFVNEAAVQTLGASDADQLIGTNIADVVHPDYRDLARNRVDAVLGGGGRVPVVEQRFNTLDGRCIDVDVVAAWVMMDGEPAVLSVFTDISQRRSAEIERESLVENLRRSNEDLLQFAYIASHDLQEPLRNVASYVQLLGRRYRGKLDQDADQFIDYAVAGTKRMQEMISDLLDYSRLSSESEGAQPTDSYAVVTRVLADMAETVRASGAIVDVGRLPVVQVRPHELARIFQNLIGNAIKYAKPGRPSQVRINARRDEREWMFSVSDNGIGISEDYRDKIFAMFQRLHARDVYEGTGIGLAICRKLVQNIGGRIWFESTEGEGSTFFFTIPSAD